MYLNLSRKRVISTANALREIADYGLNPYFDVWHYSFNVEKFFVKMVREVDGKYRSIYAASALNQWSPLPLFSDIPTIAVASHVSDNPFWYYRLSSLEHYLDRRTSLSEQPGKHFPSTITYRKLVARYSIQLIVNAFDGSEFELYYNKYKAASYLRAEEVINALKSSSPGLPSSWLKIALLRVDDEVKAVGLIIDDNKSVSLINLASDSRSKISNGIMLCVKIIEYYSARSYKSFDAGISGRYGVYKDKIFLDSIPITESIVFGRRLYQENRSIYRRFCNAYRKLRMRWA